MLFIASLFFYRDDRPERYDLSQREQESPFRRTRRARDGDDETR